MAETAEVRKDFREGAVRMVQETGKPIAQVARDLASGQAARSRGSRAAIRERYGAAAGLLLSVVGPVARGR